MESSEDGYNPPTEPVRFQEKQPLLPITWPTGITLRERLAHAHFIPRRLHLPSKSAVLILFWSLLVGAIYMTAKGGVNFAAAQLGRHQVNLFHSYDIVFVQIIFVLVFILYPLAGFLADTRYGRYRVIFISLCLLASAMALFSVDSILLFTKYTSHPFSKVHHHGIVLFYITVTSGIVILIISFAGYEANFIQFGIDQLAEAPSEYLGLFVHWVQWFTMIGTTFAQVMVSFLRQCSGNISSTNMVASIPLIFLIPLIAMLIFTYWKRHWFTIEPARSNPYKVVIQVINFARKHKFPFQQSTLIYTDEEQPSRLDFAKERYGGPFTTEQVEDVKTFLRVLVILLALGPVFALEIPAGPLLPIFIEHLIKQDNRNKTENCDLKDALSDSASIKSIAIVILFPVYVWLIYCVLRQCIPRTFTRIKVGIVALVTGLMCMFLIELLAHILRYKHHKHGVRCMFREITNDHHYNHLALPWSVNIAPGILIQAGVMIIITTTFEFISAQSPYSMKGLLIGVMFAIRGIFQLLFSVAILPFSIMPIWGSYRMKTNPPPIFNCGFGYLLFTCIVGLTGLVLFTLAVKRYRYRERNDQQYYQTSFKEVWDNS